MNKQQLQQAIELTQQYCIQLGIHVVITPTGRVVEKDLNGNCPIGRTAAELASRLTEGHERRLLAGFLKWAKAFKNSEGISSDALQALIDSAEQVFAEGE